MKKIILLIAVFCPLFILGQSNLSQISTKPEISLTVNTVDPYISTGPVGQIDDPITGYGHFKNMSLAIGLTGKYFFSESKALRFRFIYTNRNIKEKGEDVGAGVDNTYDFRYKQTLLKFSPGFQWTFTKNKISLFGGLELPFTIIGKMTENVHEIYNSGVIDESVGVLTIPGGFSIGPGIFLGSNYYFTDHFSIGFDLATAYQYTSVGGTVSVIRTETGAATTTTQYENTIQEMRFLSIQAGINITVKF